jgi:hypothetical protein
MMAAMISGQAALKLQSSETLPIFPYAMNSADKPPAVKFAMNGHTSAFDDF